MIKAKYTGVDNGSIERGRVYPISTQCRGNNLIVSVRNEKRSYRSLELFLKEWKIISVGKSRKPI